MPATLINLAAGGLVVGALSLGLCSMQKMASYPTLNSESQEAERVIAADVRQAGAVEQADENRVVLKSSAAGRSSRITYVYDPGARTLTRADARTQQVILTDLDHFSFRFFQRPNAYSAFAVLTAAQPEYARMVGCRWSCSRKSAGAKVDTETVELAPLVLRNHA